MQKKAKANIQAGEVLNQSGCLDACVSRAYYAAYQAAWSWFVEAAGQTPPRAAHGGRYFRHHEVADDLREHGGCSSIRAEDFERLLSARIRADYYADETLPEEAEEYLRLSREFVNDLLNPDNLP